MTDREKESRSLLFISPTLSVGGAERVLTMVANDLVDDFDVSFVIINGNDQRYSLHTDISSIILNRPKLIFAIWEIVKQIKTKNPDVVIGSATHVNVVLIIVRWFFRLRYRILIRESSIPSVMSKYRRRRFSILILAKLLYRHADKIICQSQDMSADIQKLCKISRNKITVIPNPLDISSLPKKTKSDNNVLQLVNVARFVPAKGHMRLMEVIKGVSRPVKLRLVGDGPLLTNVRLLVQKWGLSEKVQFEGNHFPPYKFLQTSDIFIQASFVEGFPNAALEALGCGLPVLAFDVPGGTKELINETNGFLIEDGNLRSMVEAINSFDQKKIDSHRIRTETSLRYNSATVLKQYRDVVTKLFSLETEQ